MTAKALLSAVFVVLAACSQHDSGTEPAAATEHAALVRSSDARLRDAIGVALMPGLLAQTEDGVYVTCAPTAKGRNLVDALR